MICRTLLAWTCFTSMLFGQDTIGNKRMLLVGDETPLIKVQTKPEAYFTNMHSADPDTVMYFVGAIRPSDYYNYGFREKQADFCAFEFKEAITPTRLGGEAYLYLRREKGPRIVDEIASRVKDIEARHPEISVGTAMAIIRVKAILRSDNFEHNAEGISNAWNLFEMKDAQFMEGDKWGPWIIEQQEKAKAAIVAAADKAKEAAADAAEKAKKAAAAEAVKETERQRQARTRTWHDKSGRHSVTAEYRGVGQGSVLLQKTDGTTIKVPLDSLSDVDRKWVDDWNTSRKKAAAATQHKAKNKLLLVLALKKYLARVKKSTQNRSSRWSQPRPT